MDMIILLGMSVLVSESILIPYGQGERTLKLTSTSYRYHDC